MIKIDDLSFRYEDEEDENKFAVSHVSLHVQKGEFVCILGQNGSGKSTLSKLINGLFTPTSGRIVVDGMDTSDQEKIWDIRRTAGMVFQNPDNQMVATIVEEDVAFGPENLGIEPTEIRQRVDDALKMVGMYEHRLRSPEHLSGGQKQRVAIAGVLAMNPKCIIFDESTAMLDPSGRREVLSVIKKLNQQGMTVLLITHHMDEAVMADRVIVMGGGGVVMRGTPYEIFDRQEEIVRLGLDIPYSVYASKQLAQKGFSVPLSLYPEEIVQNIRTMLSLREWQKGEGVERGSAKEESLEQGLPEQRRGEEHPVVENQGKERQAMTFEKSSDDQVVKRNIVLPVGNDWSDGDDDLSHTADDKLNEVVDVPTVAVELDAVSHIYDKDSPTEYPALVDVTNRIQKGELIGLIGHTGSGKSTLIQHINGLLSPTSGRIVVSNLDITDYRVSSKPSRKELIQHKKNLLEIRKHVGLVFQYPEYQLFEETVVRDIMFGPLNLGVSEEEARRRAEESMGIVGLSLALCDKSPFELSGGQKRRVAIAGVLAMEPDVLILDEPTAGLDPAGRDEILGEIKKLHQDKNRTIIVVSHSMDDMASFAERLIVMNKGRIFADGTPRHVFKKGKSLEKIGLGVPEVTAVLGGLKNSGLGLDASILKWSDSVEELARAIRSHTGGVNC